MPFADDYRFALKKAQERLDSLRQRLTSCNAADIARLREEIRQLEREIAYLTKSGPPSDESESQDQKG